MNIISQMLGILAIIAYAIAPHQKNKKGVLVFQLIASILYALQYSLLYAFSAVITNVIGGIKNCIFYFYEKNEKNIPQKILWGYIVVILLLGIVTFGGIYTLIPIIMSVLSAYAVWQNNLTVYRVLTIVVSTAWIIYNYIVGAYVSIFGNVFQLISTIIAMIRLDLKKSVSENNIQ